MGGVLRSLWRRPNLDHGVENPLLTSAAAQVDSISLDAQPPFGELAPDHGHDGDDPPVPADHAPRLTESSSAGESIRRQHHSTIALACGYQAPRFCDLKNELIMVDWYQLGVQLELPPDRLDKIEEDSKGAEKRLCKVLQYWLTNETNPSWDKICEALHRMGGFARIIRELKVKYCSLSAHDFCCSITCAHCYQHHNDCKFIYKHCIHSKARQTEFIVLPAWIFRFLKKV